MKFGSRRWRATKRQRFSTASVYALIREISHAATSKLLEEIKAPALLRIARKMNVNMPMSTE
jgi:hypothetical protein